MSGEIIIAGGGIGGLSTALSLAAAGYRVRVLEQAVEFTEVGAGIQLGPNVLRMLDRLGVVERMLATASLPDNIIYRDAISGSEVTRVRYGEAFRERYGYPYVVIYRPDLLSVLVDACRARPDAIALVNGVKLASFAGDADRVGVTAEDGRTFEGVALIGCDGLRSVVREALLGDGGPRNVGQVAYRAVLPMAEVPDHLVSNDIVLWGGPRLHLAHYPLRNNTLFNMGAIFHSDSYDEGRDVYGEPDEMFARFEVTCPDVRLLLGKIETWRRWSLFDREPAERWGEGRTTLLGDAAHPMLQYLGQGAGMAIEDAVILGEELAGACGGDIAPALRAYEQRRLLRTGRVQITSRVYGELFHAQRVARTLRNQLLGGITQDDTYRNLDWLYQPI